MSSEQQKQRTPAEQEAANIMAGLSAARENAKDESSNETRRNQLNSGGVGVPPPKKRKFEQSDDDSGPPVAAYPFFGYTDRSRDQGIDRLALLEEADHVPSFPVKLHAILSDPELHTFISWDDHGRSFKVLKPREFESIVLPRFFDHASLPSFQRQVNGWNFKRLTEGEYRNSYYEEHFLRSLPWLCKKMQRPRVGQKKKSCVEHEPDLAAISAIYPVPNGPVCREIQIVLATIKAKGSKAKVPSSWIMESGDAFQSSIPPEVANDHVNQSGAPSLSIHAANPFGTAAAAAAAPPLSAIAFLQQIEQARNLQGALQQNSGPSVPNCIQVVGNQLRAQNNLIMAALTSNSNPVVLPGNPLQALLQGYQNQVTAATAMQGLGVSGSLVNPVVALALLLANQHQLPSHSATATPTPDASQLLMAMQSQAPANKANLNHTDASQVSTDSNSTNGEYSNGGNFRTLDEILQVILMSNDLGKMTLQQVNRLFKQK